MLATKWGRKRREGLDGVAEIWNNLELDLTLLFVRLSIHLPVQTLSFSKYLYYSKCLLYARHSGGSGHKVPTSPILSSPRPPHFLSGFLIKGVLDWESRLDSGPLGGLVRPLALSVLWCSDPLFQHPVHRTHSQPVVLCP